MSRDARTRAVVAPLVLLGICAAAPAQAQTQPQSREELLRRYDLNSDGRIDEAEAEQARARMRRDRAATIQQSGIDPLTGRPRGEQTPAGTAASPGRVDDRQTAGGDGELLLVPGNPDGKPAAPPKPKVDTNTGAEPRKESAPRNAGATPRPSITTGGVRAGAPAVRPGYGATGPKTDLNAGRLPAGLPPSRGLPAQPASPQRATSPTAQPLRPGTVPPAGAAQRAARPTAPRPALFPQPRVSAEDIGR